MNYIDMTGIALTDAFAEFSGIALRHYGSENSTIRKQPWICWWEGKIVAYGTTQEEVEEVYNTLKRNREEFGRAFKRLN